MLSTNKTPQKSSKVIVITGASSGIGKAAARVFCSHGYKVILAARRIDLLEEISQNIKDSGGDALVIRTDVGEVDDIKNLVQEALNHFGRIDVLFNNAGFGHMNWLECLDTEVDIRYQVEVNLLGMILLTKEILPHMIENHSGHIINMSSIAGFIGTPTYSIYTASKFGIRGFTESIRREVSVFGIHVTGIYPGGVDTEFKQHMGFDRKSGLTTPHWLRLSSEQVAMAVYRATIRPRKTIIIPKLLHFAILMNRYFPWFIDWVITSRFTIPERTQM